ncbi:MAG: hypothetical protein HY265_08695 [Deltaproteobacteria bacterium]|nr:hypothetical protein [Deltaproteobacteria bacterium]MBI3756223.1 hypothetical protein [Deltaproteobacteria bacterium]
MAEEKKTEEEKEPVPAWQLFYDDIMLLFFLGVAIPTLIYTVWGLMEIVQIPELPVFKP